MTTNTTQKPAAHPLFGEVIHVYTAEQAVADGVLYDARKLEGADRKTEAGLMFSERYRNAPVYLTAALHALIEKAVKHPRWCNDWAGVCWDVVWMAQASGAIKRATAEAKREGCGRASFVVIITGAGRRRNQVLDAVINGDGLTFSLQGED